MRQQQAQKAEVRRQQAEQDEAKGYESISGETFVLDGKDLAAKAAKVSLSGVYIREGNLDVLYADARAVMMAHQGLRQPSVPLLTDDASREFREHLLTCQSNPASAQMGCPVAVLGRVTTCTLSNAFGAARAEPCVAVEDGRQLASAPISAPPIIAQNSPPAPGAPSPQAAGSPTSAIAAPSKSSPGQGAPKAPLVTPPEACYGLFDPSTYRGMSELLSRVMMLALQDAPSGTSNLLKAFQSRLQSTAKSEHAPEQIAIAISTLFDRLNPRDVEACVPVMAPFRERLEREIKHQAEQAGQEAGTSAQRPPPPEQAGDGQRIARVCAGDFERLCAGRVPVPAIDDFQKGGHIYSCLQEHIASGQLSQPCSGAIMSR
jgi:hypothetical protein